MKSNMYSDSIKQWNVFIGCRYSCTYCKKSFQAQMKRQKHNCIKCYNYEPHTHPLRLTQSLPYTKGDEFIWVGSSGDISFCNDYFFEAILERVKSMPKRTFFFQTKNPKWFEKWTFPKNTILGITLETNRNTPQISKAPSPFERANEFYLIQHPRKFITIEPILEFDFKDFLGFIHSIYPERVYIGFDTKKNNLYEPSVSKVKNFIKKLKRFTIVKEKYMKGEK